MRTHGEDDSLHHEGGTWRLTLKLPRQLRYGLASIALFSIGLNILQIAIPIYSMQVFDRVLASGSTSTLIALTAIVAFFLTSSTLLDGLRAQMLVRLSNALEIHWRDILLKATFCTGRLQPVGHASLRDLDLVKNYLASPAMAALMDLPWSSLFLAAIFSLAPLLGWLTLGAAGLLLINAAIGESLSGRWSRESQAHAGEAQRMLEASLTSRDAILSMGAEASIRRRIAALRDGAAASGSQSLERMAWITAIARGVRGLMQVIVLMAAAMLVLSEEIPGGIIVASSMLFTRALAPIERVAGSFRALQVAWDALCRLMHLPSNTEASSGTILSLPSLAGRVDVVEVSGRRSPAAAIALEGISFCLESGRVLVLIGSSGSGKSTLARLLVGALRPASGTVRLDGAAVEDWNPEQLGRQIGFLSQELQLHEGTVAEVIARFGPIDDAKVVAAAHRAGAHELILALPKGYQTIVGRSANGLSAGERQRIALARAFYGEPAFLVLDEPTVNLDDRGEKHILNAIKAAKERGATIVIVSRLSGLLHIADHFIMLERGRMRFFKSHDDFKVLMQPRLAAAQQMPDAKATPSYSGRTG